MDIGEHGTLFRLFRKAVSDAGPVQEEKRKAPDSREKKDRSIRYKIG
jgi:hypothetical protein